MASLTVSKYLEMLEQDPENEGTYEELRELLVGGDPERIGESPIRDVEMARARHEERGEIFAVARLIDVETALTADDPAFEAALLRELGRLRHEELLDYEGALDAYRRSLELVEDEDVTDAIDQIEQTGRRWRQIADRFVVEAEAAGERSARTSFFAKAASLVWQYRKKAKSKEADKLFSRAMEASPGDVRVARLYGLTLEERERWSDAAELYVRTADECSSDAERASLLLHAGRLYQTRVNDQGNAVEAFERALDLRPAHEGALGVVVGFHMEREDWDSVVSTYEHALDADLSEEGAKGILLQLGMVHWRFRNSPEDAEPFFERLREIDGSNPAMLDFFEQWEGLQTTRADEAKRSAEATRQKAHEESALAQSAEQSALAESEKAQVFVAEAPQAESIEEPSEASSDEASTAEEPEAEIETEQREAASPDAAVERAARDESPEGDGESDASDEPEAGGETTPEESESVEAAAATSDASEGVEAETDSDATASESVEKTPALVPPSQARLARPSRASEPFDPGRFEKAVEHARTIGEGNIERAIDAWKAVLRQQANHPEAVEHLSGFYRKTEKWNALVEILRGKLDAASPDDVPGRIAILREMVSIYREHLRLDVMAIKTFNAILTLDPSDQSALDELASTYESMGRWNDLIKILERQAEAARETSEKVALLARVANLWIERFANYNQATKPYETILEFDPDHREALSRLKDIYTKKRAWNRLYDVMRKEVTLASDPTVRLDLRIELAKLAGDRLHLNDDAISFWSEIVDEAPETTGALDSLEKLAERGKDWKALAKALSLKVEHEHDDSTKIRILQKLGNVQAERLEDPLEAAKAWKGILAIDPKNGRAMRTLRESFVAVGDWEALEGLYAEADDWEGLADVLGSAAERSEDVGVKIQLSFRAAEVYEHNIGEPYRAFRNYERILAVDPKNVRAVEALVPIYEKDEKWSRLVGLHEVLLDALPDDASVDQRLDIFRTLRSLCHERLANEAAAFSWAARGFELAPERADVIEELEAAAASANKFADLSDLLSKRLAETDQADEVLRLRRRLAALAGERLGRSDEAIAQLKQILEDNPQDAEAIDVLDGLYRSEGRWKDLERLSLHRLSFGESDRREALLELARLAEEQLDDVETAASRYREVLDLDGSDAVALSELDRLAEAAGRWEELVDVLMRQRSAGLTQAEEVALLLRLASTQAERLSDFDGSQQSYSEVLGLDRANERAISGLEELSAKSPERAVAIGRVLEETYVQLGRHGRLARVLRQRLDETTDETEQQELRLRIAELAATELGDMEGAYDALEAAFLGHPEDVSLWDRLAAVAEASGKQRALADAFARAIESGALSDADAADLSAQVAQIYDVVLGEPEKSEPYHRTVLMADPVHERSFQALKELFTTKERWSDLETLYATRIDSLDDPSAKLELLLQLCFLFEEIIDDPSKAIDAYRRVVELDPRHGPSRRALERLYRKVERWADLAEHLEEDRAEAEGQEMLDLSFELAQLYQTRLDRPESAVELYEAVLAQSPTHLRSQEALHALLEKPTLCQRIASILEPLYEGQGAWSALAHVLEMQLGDVDDAGSRVPLLVRLGELYDQRIHDADQAFAAFGKAVLADPTDGHCRQELARVASLRGKHAERASILEEAVADVNDPFTRSEMLLEIARIWDDIERDFDAAEKTYRRLIEADPDNADTVLPAAQALERIHLNAERYSDLAEDLRLQIRLESDPETKGAFLLRLADLLETALDDVPGSIAAHQDRVELDPGDIDALRSLERLFEQTGQWSQVVEVLRSRDGALDDMKEQRVAIQRVAAVYETQLSDIDNAIATYSESVSRFGPDVSTLEALSRLYRDSERWSELSEVLEMREELASDEAERAEVRFQSATIQRLHLGEVERAIEAYNEVLTSTPGHEGAVQALAEIAMDGEPVHRAAAARVLVPWYEERSRFAELVTMLRVLAEYDDPYERVAALRRAAQVAESGLDDASVAFALMGDAVRLGSGDSDLPAMVEELNRLAAVVPAWDRYVAILDETAPDILDADLQTTVLMEIAAVCSRQLEDGEKARALYSRVLENRPDHAEALDALETLYAEAEDYDALLRVLQRKAEIADSGEARVDLLLRQARLCDEVTGSVEIGIDALEQVLMESQSAEAYERLARLYTRAERPHDLAGLYERQIESGVGDTVDIRYRLGRLQKDALGDAYAAVESFGLTLQAHGGHEGAIAALEELMSDPDHRSAAAEILEPVFLARMEWGKVTSTIEARLAAEADVDERKEMLGRLGEIHEDYLEDLDGAMQTYARLFREDPTDEEVWETLRRLARVLEKWVELADIFADALSEITVDEPETAKLAFLTGELYDERGGDPARAEPFYRRALVFEPTDRAAYQALESVYRRGEEWGQLASLYRNRFDVAESDAERLGLLHTMAANFEERLEDPDSAVGIYREALEIEPTDAVTHVALDRILTKAERWYDLADHLRFRVEQGTGDGSEIELKHRLAKVLAERLDDESGAVDLLDEIVQSNPRHSPTIAYLEKLVVKPDHTGRITEILEPLYRDADEWMKLIAVLEAKVRFSDDPQEKLALLAEIGALHEERGRDGDRSFDAWARAFEVDPDAEAPRRQVDRIASLTNMWNEHVAAYEKAVSASDDPVVVSELLTVIARVHDEKRGDPRAAIDTYERLIRHDPEDASPLDALEALHTMVGDWAGLVEILERKVERSYDPQIRGELLRRAGSVLEELIGDVDGAIERYRRAADEDEQDPVALEALDRIYSEKSRFEDLADVLARRVEVEQDEALRAELGLRLGAVNQSELTRPDAAIDAYLSVLEIQPQHAEALAALAELYEQESRWNEVVGILEQQADASDVTEETRLTLIHRQGTIFKAELEDLYEAIARFEQALQLDSTYEPAVHSLIEISAEPEFREQVAELLEPTLNAAGRWDELAALLQARVEIASDPMDRAALLRRLSKIHDEGRGDQLAAFDTLRQAFAADDQEVGIVEELGRLAEATKSYASFADALAAKAGAAADPAQARDLYVRLAAVAETYLDDDARAIEAFVRALEQVGEEEALLEPLDRLYTKIESHADIADVVQRRSLLVADEAARTALTARLGTLRLRHLDDPRGALDSFREVVESDPSYRDALDALEELSKDRELGAECVEILDTAYRTTGSLDRVAGLYRIRIDLLDDPVEKVRMLQELGRLLEQDLGQSDKALEALREAFLLDPRDGFMVAEMERLAGATAHWEALRGTVEKVCETGDLDSMLRRELLLKAASWYRDQLAEVGPAESCLRAAIEAEPESRDAHEQLVALLRVGGREAELVAALRTWAQNEVDEHERKERLREAARLAGSSGNDRPTAISCLEELLQIDPTDAEALSDLARYRQSDGQHSEAVELLNRLAEVSTDPAERVALRRRIADAYMGPLGDVDKAIETHLAILDEDPSDIETIDQLEGIYRERERWDELRDLLERRLDIADSDEDRITARVRLAKLAEEALGNRDDAIAQLREILEIDPVHGEALDELERLLELAEGWDELAELLDRRSVSAASVEDEVAVLERLGALQLERLANAELAAATYDRILEKEPGRLETLQALVGLFERENDWQRCFETTQRLFNVQEGTEAVATALRMAQVALERLEDADRAELALRRAIEIDPSAERPRAELRQLYEQNERYAELASMLAEDEAGMEEPAQRVELLRRVATIYQEHLDDAASAAVFLERAAELTPEDRDVLLPLCDLYIAAGRQVDAVPVLERIIESFGSKRRKEVAVYHHRLGQAALGLGDRAKALEHFDAAFKIDLTSVPILRDMGRLCLEEGDTARAQKTFRALLLQKLQPADGITKADVYFYLGDIAHREGDARKAVSMLERAISEQADHPHAARLLSELKG